MIDRLIARLAERQHGVVGVWQLLELGLGRGAIARRPRVAGVNRLNAVLATYRGTVDTRSKLERDFRALIARAGLPACHSDAGR